ESKIAEPMASKKLHYLTVQDILWINLQVTGKVNSFDLSPTRTGTFTGRCAELCGLYHSRMIFKVNVVTRAEYDAHLEDLKAADQVGAPQGAKEANEIAGLRGEDKSGNVAGVQGDGSGKS
ncbi:MAG: hypothetical protein EOP19_29655, partial [Hyphomicrobiales bacterium]